MKIKTIVLFLVLEMSVDLVHTTMKLEKFSSLIPVEVKSANSSIWILLFVRIATYYNG